MLKCPIQWSFMNFQKKKYRLGFIQLLQYQKWKVFSHRVLVTMHTKRENEKKMNRRRYSMARHNFLTNVLALDDIEGYERKQKWNKRNNEIKFYFIAVSTSALNCCHCIVLLFMLVHIDFNISRSPSQSATCKIAIVCSCVLYVQAPSTALNGRFYWLSQNESDTQSLLNKRKIAICDEQPWKVVISSEIACPDTMWKKKNIMYVWYVAINQYLHWKLHIFM